VNEDAIARVCAGVRAKVEVGGGIRDLATLERVLGAGAGRVVLGTAALEDPDFFAAACRRHPGRILAGIDARKGKVSVAGWTKDSTTDAAGLAVEVQRAGAAAIVFTDIARDGTGDGVNAAATDALADAVDVPVIASGGVASLDDVRKLRDLKRRNLEAVIVGRAIYVDALDLATALRVGRGEEP
jgi:phosphoribosylformimino-5-aminoimidazole carboxamide ribotide isomerase